MKPGDWRWIVWLKKLLSTQQPEPTRQAERIVAMQLQIVLPAKVGVIAVVVSYLFHSGWLFETSDQMEVPSPYWIPIELLRRYFPIYVICIGVAAGIFVLRRRFPPGFFLWVVFVLGLLDGVFMAGLTFITGGFESIAFWIFPGLIVLNALSIPLATPQIVLNLLLSVFYLSAGLLFVQLPLPEYSTPPRDAFRYTGVKSGNHRGATNEVASATNEFVRTPRRAADLSVGNFNYNATAEESSTEPVLPRIFVLWLLTACCYGVQVLAARQRQVFEEERESAVREAQLHSAGRLAAEFAHQIKNPLAIINNAAFSVQRALRDGRHDVSRQIKIIQEEVERSDKIVTQLMGYAQLSEGHVEKLNVAEELDYAVDQVFPPAVETGVRLEKHYVTKFPTLLMQRRHFQDAVVNLLQNAREAVNGGGEVSLSAVCRPDSSIEITVDDNGPGIPPDKLGRIFEAYYSTREKGTGLGLAIVKHNVELYAGTVRVESELGKGARFVLTFPAKTVINLG